MRIIFLLLIPGTLVLAFSPTDEGREIIALQTKPARGLVEGSTYTITLVQDDLTHARTTAGGVGIHIAHSGLQWSFTSNYTPPGENETVEENNATDDGYGVFRENLESEKYMIGKTKDPAGGDILILIKLSMHSSFQYQYRANDNGTGDKAYIDYHTFSVRPSIADVIVQKEPIAIYSENGSFVKTLDLDRYGITFEFSGKGPTNSRGHVINSVTENARFIGTITATFTYFDWNQIPVYRTINLPVNLVSSWSRT